MLWGYALELVRVGAAGVAFALQPLSVAAQAVSDPDPFHIEATVGAMYSTDARARGVLVRPRWQVAADIELERGALYAGTEHGVGFKVPSLSTTTLGIGIDYRSGRQESADAIYRGLGSVHGTLVSASYIEWTPFGPALTLYGNLSVAATRQHTTTYKAGTRGGAPITEGLIAFVDASATGADSRYMQTFYGVSAAQSSASGLELHSARAGLIDYTALTGFLIDVYPRWQIVASVGRLVYSGVLTSSPVIQRRSYPLALLATSTSF